MLAQAPKADADECADEKPSNVIQSRGLTLQLGFCTKNGVDAEAENQTQKDAPGRRHDFPSLPFVIIMPSRMRGTPSSTG